MAQLSLTVLEETSDYLIVNKPSHWLVHPTKPTGEWTVLHELKERYPEEPLALINRLDRETSGLLLVGRNKQAASLLGKMSMKREIEKDYQAIVWGNCLKDHEIIDLPLDRKGKYEPSPIYLKQMVTEKGYAARTEYWVIKRYRGFTLLRVRLHSGRLHQIRVHLSVKGHPVVGDKLYGPDEKYYLEFIETGWTEALAQKLLLKRHALHAHHLRFNWNHQQCSYASDLPKEMKEFLETLL